MTGMHQGLSAAAPLPSRSHPPLSKEELSTLHRSGTFYFALTREDSCEKRLESLQFADSRDRISRNCTSGPCGVPKQGSRLQILR